MSTTSLVAEFLVIGLIPFLTVAFAALSVLGVYDFSFLSQMKDSSNIVVVVATVAVYLLGALTHRLGQTLSRNSMRYLFGRLFELRTNSYDKSLADYVLVLQLGSEQLVSRIQYGESLTRIFKSKTITVPLLAIALASWLSVAIGWKGVAIAIVVCTLVTVASFSSFLLQRKNHQRLVEIAAKLLKRTQ